ncbi:MAG: [Ribosomal protein S5]-alanine N-acetyltransferase [Candidatus Celerinatantimonas neptuna]|nr:MAG: [Ribosomal protein S5]-alanine N-acetyltransferase [Candidatus Celerinatantimonas neptuna]
MTIFHIKTPRTQVVLVQPGLAHLFNDYCNRNREHLAGWEPPRSEHYYSLAGACERISDVLEQFRQGRALPLVALDRDGQSMIATANISNIVRGVFQAAYLGYGLDLQYQGKGYMTEILLAAIPEIFTRLKLHRLMANYIPENHRSGQVLKRVGFVEEGLAKNYLYINGKWQDHILTSKTNPDFQF